MKIFLTILILFSIILAKEDYPLERCIPPSSHLYLHFFISGLSSYAVSYASSKILPHNKLWQNVVIGSSFGLTEGIAKELFDYSRGYDFSSKDLTTGVAGIILFEGIFITINF